MKQIIILQTLFIAIWSEIVQDYHDNVQVPNTNTSFNIQTDSYCFCDLKLNAADNQCCCDSLITDKTNCLLGSVKKSCIKKYILSKQNVDSWIQVQEENNYICFIYEKGTLSTNDAKLPDLFNNPNLLETYLKYYIIPDSKLKSQADASFIFQQYQQASSIQIYYKDSNGICNKFLQTINNKQIEKQTCLMISCLVESQLTSNSNSYIKNNNVYTLSTSTSSLCKSGQSIFMGYEKNANPATSFTQTNQNYYVSDTNKYNYFSEVIYAISESNSNFQGKAGYEYGQYIQGSIDQKINPFGFKIKRGKNLLDSSICTQTDDLDPLNYEPLQFGKNIQFSCTYQLNSSILSNFTWNSLQIFQSFSSGSSIALTRTPIFQDSKTDFIFVNESKPSDDSIYLTQNVLIFTDEFGMTEGRQNYIRQVNIIYTNKILKSNIPASTSTYRFQIKVKFINLPYDQIENQQPQDPPFIPQLPSDIFFPIWYETFSHQLKLILIICILI